MDASLNLSFLALHRIRVLGTVIFSLASFLLVGLGHLPGLIIFGVICASVSSGFGEITFLSLTARYDKSTVSAWSSGTGQFVSTVHVCYYGEDSGNTIIWLCISRYII